MNGRAYLVLENGKVFEGNYFGQHGETTGEVIFTTGMTGYLETLTDKSNYGQIILQTFPLIGNYGVIPQDLQSDTIGAKAYIVKYPCQNPSNFRSELCLDSFLKEQGIIGLYGIDTRSLVKIIRENGVMNGKISASFPTDKDRAEAKAYSVHDAVASVSSRGIAKSGSGSRRAALLDFGVKSGFRDALLQRDCEVWTFPHNTPAREILQMQPKGIMLSNGPGDPADPANLGIIETIRTLVQNAVPIFGIGLGHQLLALAKGYTTRKLKSGHRGANHPVKDTQSGNVYITSQNHGYEVIADNAWFVNVNDGTCEGLDYGDSFSVQFHPGTQSGPLDTAFLFDRFMERMDAHAAR